MNTAHLCPCCKKDEFSEEGSYEICTICGWEDDPFQNNNPDYSGGANVMSLNEAIEAFSEGRKVK